MSRGQRFVSIGAHVLVAVCFIIAGSLLAATFWPHDDLAIEGTGEDGSIPIINVNSEGVVTDDYILYELTYRNSGVDTLATRWLDRYDRFSVFTPIEPGIEPVGAISLPEVWFYPPEGGDSGTAKVRVQLPQDVEDGQYRLRAKNSYFPNPIRSVSVSYTTEMFSLDRYEGSFDGP